MRRFLILALAILILLPAADVFAKKAKDVEADEPKALMSDSTLSGLEFRLIGPAYNSGRITDFAVQPDKTQVIYVATASGGIWKTVNNGTTWSPIFDSEASYSIGCLAMDPSNYQKVWAGTGENNSQRSVSYGDGVYKSLDGGQQLGEHGPEGVRAHRHDRGRPPQLRHVVYVAAQGPLWASGGDRGVYKTTDGGEDLGALVLEISENTGVNEVHLDPRNPDTLYASSYQRRRRVWTLINGGPESAIYKSTDAGERPGARSKPGCPKVDMGKIGLAISPADPDVLYAIIEAQRDEGRFLPLDRPRRKLVEDVGLRLRQPAVLQRDRRRSARRRHASTPWTPACRSPTTAARPSPRSAKSTSTSTTTPCGSTPTIPITCSSAATAASTRASTGAPPTTSRRTCPSPSSTGWRSTTPSPSTTSTAAPRTTTPWAARRALWTSRASPTRTGSSPSAATATKRSLFRPIRTSSTASGSTAAWCATTAAAARMVDIQPQEEPGEDADRWNWDSPLIISPHLAHPALLRRPAALPLRRPRRLVDAVSPDLTRQIDRNDAGGHGQALEHRRGRQERLDVELRQHRRAHRVAAGRGPALRRHRRRADPGHRGWRRELGPPRQLPRHPGAHLRAPPRGLAARRGHRLRRLRQPQEGRLQALRLGQPRPRPDLDARSPATCPSAGSSTRSRRITSSRSCSSPAPSSASSSPSTAAKLDPAQGRAARPSRCATSRSSGARTTSWSPPSAAASTSSTTTRRSVTFRSRSSSTRKAILFPVKDAAALRRAGSIGRRSVRAAATILHRRQPAVRRDLHLLPEGVQSHRQREAKKAWKTREAPRGRRGKSRQGAPGARARRRGARGTEPGQTRRAGPAAGNGRATRGGGAARGGGGVKLTAEIEDHLAHLRKAILDTPATEAEALTTARALQRELDDIKINLVGDPTKAERNVFTPPSISDRVNRIVSGLWTTTQGPTGTQRETYAWAGEAFTTELGRLQTLVSNLETLENQLELAGAPWTPGRVPTWQAKYTVPTPINPAGGLQLPPSFFVSSGEHFFSLQPLIGWTSLNP